MPFYPPNFPNLKMGEHHWTVFSVLHHLLVSVECWSSRHIYLTSACPLFPSLLTEQAAFRAQGLVPHWNEACLACWPWVYPERWGDLDLPLLPSDVDFTCGLKQRHWGKREQWLLHSPQCFGGTVDWIPVYETAPSVVESHNYTCSQSPGVRASRIRILKTHKYQRVPMKDEVKRKLKITIAEAGQMTQWLRVLVILAEDMNLISRTCMVVHNHVLLQFQGVQPPLLTSVGTAHMCGTHTCIQAFIHTTLINPNN